MSKTVEFLFDFGSPTTYLAYTQLPGIAEETGAEIVWTPILLGGVFQATDNASPITVPAKGHWMNADLARFAMRYAVPMKLNPHFPVNTLPIMRGAIWAQREGCFDAYVDAMFRAMWVDGRNMGDPAEIGAVVSEAGIDAEAFAQGIQDPAVKDGLKANTQKAVERGVFGAPTFFVGDDMFFGQDRMDFVREALAA